MGKSQPTSPPTPTPIQPPTPPSTTVCTTKKGIKQVEDAWCGNSGNWVRCDLEDGIAKPMVLLSEECRNRVSCPKGKPCVCKEGYSGVNYDDNCNEKKVECTAEQLNAAYVEAMKANNVVLTNDGFGVIHAQYLNI